MGYLSDLRFKDLQLYCKPCVEEKPHGVAMKRYVNSLILKIYIGMPYLGDKVD